jgi:HK97 family phage major capsid protein
MTTAEKRERLREKLAEAQALNEKARTERRAFTPAEDAHWNELEAEIRALQLECPATEAVLKPGAPRMTQAAPDRWMDRRTGKEVRTLRPEDRYTDVVDYKGPELRVGRAILGLVTGDWSGAEHERRMLQEGVQGAGGVLLPAPLSAQVIDLARARSVVMRLGATTVPMTSATLDLARVTADPTAAWYPDEVRSTGITESDPTFGRLTLNVRTLAALVRLSIELAEDAPNIGRQIEDQLGAVLGLELDRAVLYGEGGSRAGLRDWTDPIFAVNEVSMGTNGAAITTFAPFIQAVRDILADNYPGEIGGLGLAYAPRTWAEIEALVDQQNQPLNPPQSFRDLKKLVSTQVAINETQGSAGTAASAFVGFWPECLVGLRTDITIEATRVGDDAFKRLHVLVRAYLRADWSFARPNWFSRIIGTIPA